MQNNLPNILKEMNFDSSLFSDLDKILSKEEYVDTIFLLLQPILDNHFKTCQPKTKILLKNNRINFACPYCDDSMKDIYRKRGNIILDGKHINHYKCHNCGIKKRVDYFFKDFKVELKLDFINYISSTLNNENYQHIKGKYDASLLLDMNEIEKYAIDREELKSYFKLVEVKGTKVWPWLVKRHQYNESKFLYNPQKNYLAILNLTPNGKILGLQKRLLIKTKNKYNTFKLSKLYELMKKNESIPDLIDIFSQLFNICLINFNRDVTLFEGPLDSFLFKNSIANTGANKEFPIEIPIRYFYDMDKTGKGKSLEYINSGYSVFLWNRLDKDFNLPIREKWDLNDFIIYCKEQELAIPNFEIYFSSDHYDAIDI